VRRKEGVWATTKTAKPGSSHTAMKPSTRLLLHLLHYTTLRAPVGLKRDTEEAKDASERATDDVADHTDGAGGGDGLVVDLNLGETGLSRRERDAGDGDADTRRVDTSVAKGDGGTGGGDRAGLDDGAGGVGEVEDGGGDLGEGVDATEESEGPREGERVSMRSSREEKKERLSLHLVVLREVDLNPLTDGAGSDPLSCGVAETKERDTSNRAVDSAGSGRLGDRRRRLGLDTSEASDVDGGSLGGSGGETGGGGDGRRSLNRR
jgi:hypothetical protein